MTPNTRPGQVQTALFLQGSLGQILPSVPHSRPQDSPTEQFWSHVTASVARSGGPLALPCTTSRVVFPTALSLFKAEDQPSQFQGLGSRPTGHS